MSNVDYRDGFLVQNASATQRPFVLLGGKYGVTCSATFSTGNVSLQILGPDAATFINTLPAFTANGAATADLPPGKYQVLVTAPASAVNLACVPISYRK
jgi:hypothetical protein